MKRSIGIGLVLIVLTMRVLAQVVTPPQQLMIKPKGQIVCYKNDVNDPIYLPPRFEANPAGRTQTADIQVEYVGFPPDAQASFVRAVDIWKTLIQSNVRINIRAAWVPQDANVLGSAIWGNAFANFDGAPKLNVFYPVALAEKIAGKKLNGDPNPTTGDDYDIYAFFNSTQSRWNFTDTPILNTYNFTTVVLHEIGHGLGFTDSYDLENGLGSFGVQTTATPMIFDVGVENGAGARLINQANNTTALATALTNSNVNYNPSRSLVGVASEKPKLYAPSEWSSGSSIAHLDQATYSGTNNRLMRPQLDLNSVVLDPGPIVLNMFADMGWVAPSIVHTPLKDTEVTSNDFTVSVTASSDGTSGYSINNQVKLRYQVNGGAEVELVQAPTSGNQYIFTLPKPSQSIASTTYSYYLVVTDSYNGQNRTFSKPGQFIRPEDSDLQATFQFKAGPDTTIPVIVHTPKDFVLEGTTSLELKVFVTDNIGVQGVKIDYKINAGSLQMLSLVQDNDTTSLYKATLPTTGLVNGTTISYRITATDNSSNANSALAPTATTFYEVAVIGTAPAQNSYSNDFNSPSSDFFGNGYSIITPAGFSNGAIHSSHPYPEAGSGSLNFSYQLRVPIKVKAQGASIKFDEIVLVEPGEPGSGFGTDAFYDYVVTEASKDGGVSWKPVEDGYDSRANADWLAKYNSSIISNISQGKGDPSLFKPRVLDLLKNFKAGDEILIRFRLFSDPAAAGWGWAIDNLKIQIDDEPPILLHNHSDYVIGSSNSLTLTTQATDASGVSKVFLDYSVNSGSVTSVEMPLSTAANTYNYVLDLSPLAISATNKLNYRLRSIDVLGNTVQIPAAGFFDVVRLNIGTAQASYSSDFNSPNIDFAGNFFSISTPSGFTNGAIHSVHSYPNGFGIPNATSNYAFTLTKPILISASNPYLLFDEIGIVEPLNDQINVEGSKDNGSTWQSFIVGYTATSQTSWLSAYNSKSNGTSALFTSRLVNLTQNGSFKSGDQVLIRFRMNVNSTINAWGWAIDNLNIQTPITGFERTLAEASFTIYPNPSAGSKLVLKLETPNDNLIKVHFLTANGSAQQELSIQPVNKQIEQEVNVGDWSDGFYIVKAEVGGAIVTRKFIKSR